MCVRTKIKETYFAEVFFALYKDHHLLYCYSVIPSFYLSIQLKSKMKTFEVVCRALCLSVLITISELNRKITELIKERKLQSSTIATQSKAISELNQRNADREQQMAALKQKQNTTVMFSAYLYNDVSLTPDNVVVFN